MRPTGPGYLDLRDHDIIHTQSGLHCPSTRFVFAVEVKQPELTCGSKLQQRERPGVQNLPSTLPTLIFRMLNPISGFHEQEKANVLAQMADILACLQRFELPSTLDEYGGISFDESGRYISTALSIYPGGPFAHGWRDHNIRQRLDNFLSAGPHSVFQQILPIKRVLVHADFSIDNVLYDDSSKQLTAVFGFDFAHVSSIADEFFRSLGYNIGRFPSIRDDEPELIKLHNAMLTGFPGGLHTTPQDDVDWPVAKAWDDALKERKFECPATITNMAVLADIFWLSSQILPFKLRNEVVVGNSTEEQLRQRKAEGEALLGAFLTSMHC
ncbi:hypothetical protein AMS68_005456 [Peltaster fructicola]|uniref:Aminoglycoside phosphotransferase domain-containing protein n=1 Tax=Peltaster fructicola TaxID=286661 RepID=A0A6H0XZ96_9PEZI|nr:hypothetical protein AMS68_005456 [Peltaster fructicola]